jgi:hypothetical protein
MYGRDALENDTENGRTGAKSGAEQSPL